MGNMRPRLGEEIVTSGPSLKLLVVVFTGIAPALIAMLSTPISAQQQTSDGGLSETLSWMDNSYNPHADFGALGHGRTGWYVPKSGGRPYEEVLVSGSTETFTYNGCQMTLHFEDNRAAEASKNVYSSLSYSFNLRDINPQSIKMSTYSHTGGFLCERFDPEDRAKMDCDHAEIVFKTHAEAPLINEDWDTIYSKLQGSDHENKHSSKGKEGYFEVDDDVEYANRLMRAFHHAVELCGGKPEPF
jgi:hypothetical protein